MAPAFARAFAKSQLGGGVILPTGGAVFVSVKDADKPWIEEPVRLLLGQGFRVVATGGTYAYLAAEGLQVERVQEGAGRPAATSSMR